MTAHQQSEAGGNVAYALSKQETTKPGLSKKTNFWNTHENVSIFDKRIPYSGIPLDVCDNKVALSKAETHCLITGVSGKGKTRRELYPAVILSARSGRSFVVADMKGEIYRNTAEEVKRCGHDILIFNLRNPILGNRYNPFQLVEQCWKNGDKSKATVLLKDITSILIKSVHSERDAYWEMAASDTIVGFALFLLENNYKLSFDNIRDLINQYASLGEKRTEANSMFDPSLDSSKRLSTITSLSADATLGCVVSCANICLSSFTDQEDIRDLLSTSDIELAELGKHPLAVYFICPDESTALYGIASLFVEQCYSELIRFADSREQNTLPVGVDFILDEFGSFVGSDWASKLTAARSRGIRFIIALQSMSQLIGKYGENEARTIMNNCRTLVFMGGRDIKLQYELSTLSGSIIDENGFERPVLSINDLNSMEAGKLIVFDDVGKPYFGHVPDWDSWCIREKALLKDTKRTIEQKMPVNLLSILNELSNKNNKSKNDNSVFEDAFGLNNSNSNNYLTKMSLFDPEESEAPF